MIKLLHIIIPFKSLPSLNLHGENHEIKLIITKILAPIDSQIIYLKSISNYLETFSYKILPPVPFG